MRRSPLLLVVVIATASLVACKPAAPAAAADVAPAATAEQPAETPVPAPEATAPTAVETPRASEGQAGFVGYGDMKFGSTVEEAKTAWAGELNGTPGEAGGCYYLTPKWVKKPSDFSFMIEGDKFVRYDVGTDKEAAPGGGKVGMSVDQLHKLYGESLQSTPHKYVQGGQYLSIVASGVAPSKLVFETDAAGKVSAWRVGLSPQVDYVEGCS
ncbi:MAG: lectin [Pseudoxanthomonas sp.]